MGNQKSEIETRSHAGYPFERIDEKWQKRWEETELFKAPEHPGKPYYVLVMFAYPSGDIHMGHFRNYIFGDAIARWKMMQGFDVLHPFGWDAFGLPAEQAAIKRKLHPKDWTLNNIEMSRSTLKRVGISFDWNREVASCLPDYYKFTQWMFVKLFEKGLAYRKKASVNWCSDCNTVLANEQVDSEGKCWRCGHEVTKKKLTQWFFKITEYAQRLLDGLDTLPGWIESVKAMQRNWIGRSTGCRIEFEIAKTGEKLPVFTTRPDTVYGVTFMAIAPEAPIVENLPIPDDRRSEVSAYIEKSLRKSDLERTMETGEKDGVFTGCYAINPFSSEEVQLWIADYVLASYGTGAVMAVPAHDQRDFEFAKKYDIPIKVVITPKGKDLNADDLENAYTEYGVMKNSGDFDGLEGENGIEAVTQHAKQHGIGGPEVNYRLRDWLVSRQRYWGAPIPIIHCDKCGTVPVPVDDLPVKLPEIEDTQKLVPKGRSPLADFEEYVNVPCPKCGKQAKRDPDTMDTFVCSSWYLFRYTDANNDKEPFDPEKAKEWLPVDIYIGGTNEHATGHLLYFRFFTKFLKDIGYLDVEEPTLRLVNHGMVYDAQGRVMSKSLGNVVSPMDVMKRKGVDTTRMAMYFASPAGKDVLWSEEGMVGVERFASRLYRIAHECPNKTLQEADKRFPKSSLTDAQWSVYVKLNQTIKQITEDLDRLQFNTCIAAVMEFLNDFAQLGHGDNPKFYQHALLTVTRLMAPLTPHLSEEIWEMFGHQSSVFKSGWPEYDPDAIVADTITIVVQVNGKVRANLDVPPDTPKEALIELAKANERVQNFTKDKKIIKEIVIPGRLVNLVAK